jgi:hypothetical protein
MLWEEHRLRVLENRVLSKIFGSERVKVTDGWRKVLKNGFIICTLHQILSGCLNPGE